jgi:hypothetical protein
MEATPPLLEAMEVTPRHLPEWFYWFAYCVCFIGSLFLSWLMYDRHQDLLAVICSAIFYGLIMLSHTFKQCKRKWKACCLLIFYVSYISTMFYLSTLYPKESAMLGLILLPSLMASLDFVFVKQYHEGEI